MRPQCAWNSACGLNSDGYCTFGGDCKWSSSKLEEVAPSTDVQQLKAEIAAFANELDSLYIKDCDLANAKDLVERMRQLSAV